MERVGVEPTTSASFLRFGYLNNSSGRRTTVQIPPSPSYFFYMLGTPFLPNEALRRKQRHDNKWNGFFGLIVLVQESADFLLL
jgi:hypothetical protein